MSYYIPTPAEESVIYALFDLDLDDLKAVKPDPAGVLLKWELHDGDVIYTHAKWTKIQNILTKPSIKEILDALYDWAENTNGIWEKKQ